MSFLQSALEALNQRYAEITDLIPTKYYFSDEEEASSGPLTFGINDGGDDMYDGANLINTDLTQDWADIVGNGQVDTQSIPNTHTVAGFEYNNDYTNPPMDGVVMDGSSYFGAGSEYFTNMYPDLFVMAADKISINQFSITGNIGADGAGSSTYDSASLLDGKYTLFYKSVYNANDPSINHMILVPGSASGITHNVPPGTQYDSHNITGISDRSRVFFLLTALDDNPGIELTLPTAIAVAEKFLEIVGTGSVGRLTQILPVLKLRVLAYDPLTFVSQLQPDSNLQNIIGQLESREIWLPYYDRALKHGDEITLYGQQAIKARSVINTMNSSGNAVVQVLYYGSNPPEPVNPGGSLIFSADSEGGTYLTVPSSDDWAVGTGDFTVEWFMDMNVDTSANNARVFSVGDWPGAGIAVSLEGTGQNRQFYVWLDGVQFNPNVDIDFGQGWTHIAVSRSAGTLYIYFNGVAIEMASSTEDVLNNTSDLWIGQQSDNDAKFSGLVTNFHFVKGAALYTTPTFAVPTAPLSPVPESKLLLLVASSGARNSDSSGTDKTVSNTSVAYSESTPFTAL